MGFIKGQKVTLIKKAPLKDPGEYNVMGYMVSLRQQEASLVEVLTDKSHKDNGNLFHGSFEANDPSPLIARAGKTINIALIGNPNSGKTSIFNIASKSHEKVGNYGGVTITTKLATVKYQDYTFNIFDLPGTYSLTTYSPEEIYVRDFLFNNQPDIVINIVDSTNLERNLYLTSQLIDMNLKVVIALNMYDEFTKKGNILDFVTLGKMIGIPVIPTVGSKGKGLASLFEAVVNKHNEGEAETRVVNINYGKDIETSINKILRKISKLNPSPITDRFSSRFLSLKLLEKDKDIYSRFLNLTDGEKIVTQAENEIKDLEINNGQDTETYITETKYGFIAGALKETLQQTNNTYQNTSVKIDNILTSRLLGIPIFFAFLWLTFQLTFKLGKYPTDWINSGVQWLSGISSTHLPAGSLNELFREGILGGAGGVLIFLPNILILFFFISLMEDTGYMARAAFIMDKVMHRIGLHGKSFIPLIMGFGCNVPAVLSTRIIESRNNRLVTMLILPFMSCSARLPVYILLIGAFFQQWQGTALFIIYLTGILVAALSAILFRRFLVKNDNIPFVMELPPYRIPTLRNTIRHMWSQSSEYLKRIGGVIIIASVIIWGLNYYPTNSILLKSNPSEKEISEVKGIGINKDLPASYLERFGKVIEPVMSPLGFDWKMSVSLLAGIAGKEIVVSTLGVLYESDEGETIMKPLEKRIKAEKYSSGPRAGEYVFNPIVAVSYLLFTLIYFPCVAVVAAISKESGEARWAVFLIAYTTGVAWLLSFIVYQTGKLFF